MSIEFTSIRHNYQLEINGQPLSLPHKINPTGPGKEFEEYLIAVRNRNTSELIGVPESVKLRVYPQGRGVLFRELNQNYGPMYQVSNGRFREVDFRAF